MGSRGSKWTAIKEVRTAVPPEVKNDEGGDERKAKEKKEKR